MIENEIALVAKIELSFNTYYVTNRYNVFLDGQEYLNVVRSFGDVQRNGNIEDNNARISTMSMSLVNGEEMSQNGYELDITDVWNNRTVTVKRWESGITTFAGCEDYHKGIIKGFNNTIDSISFNVDLDDSKSTQLVPSVLIVDQSGLSETEKSRPILLGGAVGTNTARFETQFWSVNEMCKLVNVNDQIQYNKIKKITGTDAEFVEDFLYDFSTLSGGNIEKPFSSVPENFIGKTIPINFGFVDNTYNCFAKTVTIDGNIGNQIVLSDYLLQNNIYAIGVWDDGVKSFYDAKEDDEFSKGNLGKNIFDFKTDSTATLQESLFASDVNDLVEISVDDSDKINFVNETTDYYHDIPSLLGNNLISINKERFQILERPDNDILFVQRATFETEKQNHSIGDKIFVGGNFATRNLLFFREKFEGESISNVYIEPGFNPTTFTDWPKSQVVTDSFDKILDRDTDTYTELTFNGSTTAQYINFDFRVNRSELDADILGLAFGVKFDYQWSYNSGDIGILYFGLQRPVQGLRFDTRISGGDDMYWLVSAYPQGNQTGSGSYNNYLNYSISGISDPTTLFENVNGYVHNSIEYFDFDNDEAFERKVYDGATVSYTDATWLGLNRLRDINRAWKIAIDHSKQSANSFLIIKLYNMSIWCDFVVNFSEDLINARLIGRVVNNEVNLITGSISGTPTFNPVDVAALILVQEALYESTDFDTIKWQTVRGYFNDSANFPNTGTGFLSVNFSYGVDDKRKESISFVNEMLDIHNLSINRLRNGKISIVNFHEIYYNTPSGYEMSIDSVRYYKDTKTRAINIYQTGSDILYNDVVINYNVNNKTGNFQKTYILNDDYILTSGNNLKGARSLYYEGRKRTLTIDSKFIVQEKDAIEKARMVANDKAEVHFWCELILDWNHYETVGKSEQYNIGDVVYLTGKHGGINFKDENKFYITDIIDMDEGREIQLKCKSIQPVRSFETTAKTGEFILRDTGGTSLTGDDIWQDTGGTSLTGDDIIQDTGGS